MRHVKKARPERNPITDMYEQYTCGQDDPVAFNLSARDAIRAHIRRLRTTRKRRRSEKRGGIAGAGGGKVIVSTAHRMGYAVQKQELDATLENNRQNEAALHVARCSIIHAKLLCSRQIAFVFTFKSIIFSAISHYLETKGEK